VISLPVLSVAWKFPLPAEPLTPKRLFAPKTWIFDGVGAGSTIVKIRDLAVSLSPSFEQLIVKS
jgi:hypothetical protein